MVLVIFLTNLILTVFTYMTIPIVFILIGKKHTLKTIHAISALSFILGFIIASLISYFLDGTAASGGGAILWTYIGHWIMKKKIAIPDISIKDDESEEKSLEKDSRIALFLAIGIISTIVIIFIFTAIHGPLN